jgi:response regulator RpfG family c-di-GMP phosphodiesterase
LAAAVEREMEILFDMTDNLMVPLLVDHFNEGNPLSVDVFFRIHSNKYIQLGKRGQVCHLRDLHLFRDKIKNKNAQFVYMHKNEFKAFVGGSLQEFHKQDWSKAEEEQKFKSLLQTTDLVIKQFQYVGISPETIESAKLLTKGIHEVARQTHNVVNLLNRFNGLPGNMGQQALCISIISAMVAVELGWASEGILEKISLGGLLHDVGLLDFPKELLTKPYLEMNAQERAVYETHPLLGAQVLRGVPGMPTEVINIVYEHHENSVGEGYPRRLDDAKINPLSKIVALADQFSELVFPSGNEEPYRPEQALNYIENILGQPYNSECYKAFKNIFGKA